MGRVEALPVSAERFTLAEGPAWHAVTGRVVWVDIPAARVHTATLAGDTLVPGASSVHVPTVGAALPAADGGLLLANHHRLLAVDADGRATGAVALPGFGAASRTNDAKCDPAGRVLVGSAPTGGEVGGERLWRLEHDGTLTVLDDDLRLSNGIAWSPDGRLLYSVDSLADVVWVRDYDPEGLSVGQRRAFLATDRAAGLPDGLAVDVEGCVWMAVWGGACVRRHAPDGRVIAEVATNAPHTTSVAFVGDGLDRLLVTSAREGLDDAALAAAPASGALFLVDVGVAGVPITPWAGAPMGPVDAVPAEVG